MSSSFVSSVYANIAFTGFAAILSFLITDFGFIDLSVGLVLMTSISLSYLWIEVSRIRRIQRRSWLVNPIVFCSIMTFCMGYGITNIIYLLPAELLDPFGIVQTVTPAMIKHMLLVMVAELAMFLGFWSHFAARCSAPDVSEYIKKRLMPSTDNLKKWVLPVLTISGLMGKMYAIRGGFYGFGARSDVLYDSLAYSQYVEICSGMSRLALVLSAFVVYGYNSSSSARSSGTRWMVFIFITEVMMGFMSGYKSSVAIPVVMIGICQYICTGSLKRRYLYLSVIAMVLAYGVIEPYRALRVTSSDDFNSISSIAEFLLLSISGEGVRYGADSKNNFVAMLARFNLTSIGAYGVEYSDSLAALPLDAPGFLGDIFMSPLYAWVPRFLWENKPAIGELGSWYAHSVLDIDPSIQVSVAMGPIVYLYFAGGFIAVGLAFFIIGIIHRVLFSICNTASGSAGGVLLLFTLKGIGFIDSGIPGVIILFLRDMPMLILVMSFFFERSSVKKRITA